jgi:hypothetical protein
MKQVMNYNKDNGLLNMIRRTDPMINEEAGHGWQENMSSSAHASVYAQQINSDTFLKTTKNYQNGIIHSFLNILESAIRDGVSDKRINSLIDDANNSLKKSGHQIVYERDGGDSFNLYFR